MKMLNTARLLNPSVFLWNIASIEPSCENPTLCCKNCLKLRMMLDKISNVSHTKIQALYRNYQNFCVFIPVKSDQNDLKEDMSLEVLDALIEETAKHDGFETSQYILKHIRIYLSKRMLFNTSDHHTAIKSDDLSENGLKLWNSSKAFQERLS